MPDPLPRLQISSIITTYERMTLKISEFKLSTLPTNIEYLPYHFNPFMGMPNSD